MIINKQHVLMSNVEYIFFDAVRSNLQVNRRYDFEWANTIDAVFSALSRSNKYGIVFLDAHYGNGVTAFDLQKILSIGRSTRIILLVDTGDECFSEIALQYGAFSLVSRAMTLRDVNNILNLAESCQRFVPWALQPQSNVGVPKPYLTFTYDDLYIFHCLSLGLYRKHIAQRMGISCARLAYRAHKVYKSLNIQSQTEAIYRLQNLKLIPRITNLTYLAQNTPVAMAAE